MYARHPRVELQLKCIIVVTCFTIRGRWARTIIPFLFFPHTSHPVVLELSNESLAAMQYNAYLLHGGHWLTAGEASIAGPHACASWYTSNSKLVSNITESFVTVSSNPQRPSSKSL